jgi:hypothetical protein
MPSNREKELATYLGVWTQIGMQTPDSGNVGEVEDHHLRQVSARLGELSHDTTIGLMSMSRPKKQKHWEDKKAGVNCLKKDYRRASFLHPPPFSKKCIARFHATIAPRETAVSKPLSSTLHSPSVDWKGTLV